MDIRDHRAGVRNRCVGVRNNHPSICNYLVSIRNHHVGIDCQLGLKEGC